MKSVWTIRKKISTDGSFEISKTPPAKTRRYKPSFSGAPDVIESTDDYSNSGTDCPRWLLPLLCVLVVLFTAPALTGGFHLDDWHQLEVLKGEYDFTTGESPYIEFFTFATGDREHTQQLIDRGCAAMVVE